MVKKLIKHEFIYYIRTLSIFLPILLAIGVMTRIIQFFESDSAIYTIAIFSSSMMLYVASFACLIVTAVISIVRFYKNMYSSEGYLTFTLPVTNAQHIFAKLLVAMVCQLASVITIVLAAMIALSGEPLIEIFKSIDYLLKELFTALNPIHAALYIIEVIILLIICAASGPLMYYACITVGQTAKKNRILLAVGAYFIYYMATQVLSTVLMIIVSILGSAGALDWIVNVASAHPYATVHVFMIVAIVIQAALAALFFLVTHRIMSKKLNLE